MKIFDESTEFKLIDLNWERIRMLSHANERTEPEKEEYSLRVAFQNSYACCFNGDDCKDREKLIDLFNEINRSLSPSLIKKIDTWSKENK